MNLEYEAHTNRYKLPIAIRNPKRIAHNKINDPMPMSIFFIIR